MNFIIGFISQSSSWPSACSRQSPSILSGVKRVHEVKQAPFDKILSWLKATLTVLSYILSSYLLSTHFPFVPCSKNSAEGKNDMRMSEVDAAHA